MRIGHVHWALAVTALCGCDAVFGLHGDDDGPAPIDDARPPDGVQPVDCDPLTETLYDITLPSQPGHRYRITADEDAVRRLATECAADAPGGTHLFAPSTTIEVDQMLAVISNQGLRLTPLFIGVVQNKDQRTVDAGWRLITGAAFDPMLWSSGEPDDGGDVIVSGGFVEDNDENIAALWASSGGLVDDSQDNTYQAICECDGLPADPDVTAVLAAY